MSEQQQAGVEKLAAEGTELPQARNDAGVAFDRAIEILELVGDPGLFNRNE